MLVAAHEYTVDGARRAAVLDELRDQDGKDCAPGSLHAGFFAELALREHGELITVLTDRRLFLLTDEDGLILIVGTFVDDSKVMVQSESKAAEFSKAWEKR